ncbi:MAG: ELM1/GtrOC1 family putative glycosyltransferase, partial [Methyloceanibacter sp.]
PEHAAAFGQSLARVARDSGGSLLVTPSRRTSPEALQALSAAIVQVPPFVWEGTGGEPSTLKPQDKWAAHRALLAQQVRCAYLLAPSHAPRPHA